MPRHPRIALTSRLRIHTINDKSGTRVVAVPGACIKRPSQHLRRDATTQLDKDDCCDDTHLPRSAGEPSDRKRSMPPRHRFLEPIHNVKDGGEPPIRGRSREMLVFISGKYGGASRDRTDDLKLAKLALSQLSYGPKSMKDGGVSTLSTSLKWWAEKELNLRPHAYQACALTT